MHIYGESTRQRYFIVVHLTIVAATAKRLAFKLTILQVFIFIFVKQEECKSVIQNLWDYLM